MAAALVVMEVPRAAVVVAEERENEEVATGAWVGEVEAMEDMVEMVGREGTRAARPVGLRVAARATSIASRCTNALPSVLRFVSGDMRNLPASPSCT